MEITIGNRKIGDGHPPLIVAEMSSNHSQDLEKLKQMIRAAGVAGADAVKLQTYTPDTITLNCDKPWFQVGAKGNPDAWTGQTFHELYRKSYTPWEWHRELKELTESLGMLFFSSAFDATAVDFLHHELDVACFKIASYEATDIPLLRKMAKTGKPIIMSVGFATLEEVEHSMKELRGHGARDIVLLQCTTSYASEEKPEYTNLATMRDLRKRFRALSGFSDNMGGVKIPAFAVSLGAAVIEKHLVLKHDTADLDDQFSLDPQELKSLIALIQKEKSAVTPLGKLTDWQKKVYGAPTYGPQTKEEEGNRRYRRALYAGWDIKKGELFTLANVRDVRPAPEGSLAPRYIDDILGKRATQDIEFGTPLTLEMVEKQ